MILAGNQGLMLYRPTLALVCALVANVTASHAQPAPEAHNFTAAGIDEITVVGVMNPPPWKPSRPGEAEPERYYPEKAALAKVEGYATLQCQVAPGGGTPHDCRVLEETPEGWSFGETATRVLASKVNAPPEKILDGNLFLGFAFRLKNAPAPPASLDSLRHPRFTHTPYARDLAGALRVADPKFTGPGWAFVRCAATKDGRLADCTPLASSTPDGALGAAVASLASTFKLAPTDADDAPVAGRPLRLRFRVSW